MDNRKILYSKPKSLVRGLIQKLFLLLLFKFFPKKSLFYKNKIKIVMNKAGYHIRLYLAVICLRLRYPFYFNLPSTQIYAFHITIKFLKILKAQNIDCFLLGGVLLGAVRQESFAGRPSDIDLGIKKEQLQKLLDSLPLLIENGAKNIKEDKELEKIQILFPCMLIDITIYEKKTVEGKIMWVGKAKNDIPFPFVDLDYLMPIKVYGKLFMAPTNPEIYLEKRYGKNWKIPEKKQFFWNKNKIQQSKTQ